MNDLILVCERKYNIIDSVCSYDLSLYVRIKIRFAVGVM